MNAEEKREYSRVYMTKWSHEHPERVKATHARCIAKALIELADPVDPRHGKEGTYIMGCRCDRCREAHRIRTREYRARKKVAA